MSERPDIRIGKSTSEGGKKNELYVPDSMNPPQLSFKIWGESGKRVEYFHDLSADLEVNRAVITLSFDSNAERYNSDDLKEVIYRVVNPDFTSWEEWEKMENEALIDFLINKSSSLLDNSKGYEKSLECTLKKEGGKINLVVEKKGGEKKIIKSKNLRLEGEFYGKQVIRVRDVKSLTPPPKIAWWKTTTFKITSVGVLGVILALIIVFRKKIWGWIKRDKKSPKETIIF